MHIKNLTRKEIERKYSYLSGGFNAAVYELNATEVIRVSCTEYDGWRAILEIPFELRDNLGIVRIIDHWVDPTSGNVIAILEKLKHIEYATVIEHCFNTEKFNVFGTPPDIDTILTPDNMFYDIVKKAIKALQYCKANNLGIKKLDLNFLNIMQRKNGTLVLTDPFCNRADISYKESISEEVY